VQFQKDDELYHRFFAEIHLYLKQYPQTPDWHGILIYISFSFQAVFYSFSKKTFCIALDILDPFSYDV
jgi:predicted transposase YdaD